MRGGSFLILLVYSKCSIAGWFMLGSIRTRSGSPDNHDIPTCLIDFRAFQGERTCDVHERDLCWPQRCDLPYRTYYSRLDSEPRPYHRKVGVLDRRGLIRHFQLRKSRL